MSKKYTEQIWSVKITTDVSSTKSIEMFDGSAVLGEYIQLQRNFFDDLLKEMKLNKKYRIGKHLLKVTAPDGKDWTENPLVLLLASIKEKEIPLWLLIKRENNLNGYLIAIGPRVFCDYLVGEQERVEEIRKFLEYIVIYSQKWAVSAIIPTFIV